MNQSVKTPARPKRKAGAFQLSFFATPPVAPFVPAMPLHKDKQVTPAPVPVAPVARETVFAPPAPSCQTLRAYLGRSPSDDEKLFYCLESDGTWQDVRTPETAGKMIKKNPYLAELMRKFDCFVPDIS